MEFHVDEVLESSIVTGRNGNFDIPVGTVFTKIVKSRFEGEIGNSVRMTCKSLNTIELELVSVNWYRRKIDHIPRGHTAELKLKGNGIGQLEKFLAELKSDEYVYIQA